MKFKEIFKPILFIAFIIASMWFVTFIGEVGGAPSTNTASIFRAIAQSNFFNSSAYTNPTDSGVYETYNSDLGTSPTTIVGSDADNSSYYDSAQDTSIPESSGISSPSDDSYNTTYDASTNPPDSTTSEILGCTNPNASNFDSLATNDDGSCAEDMPDYTEGCTDSSAPNYDPRAESDNGSCEYSNGYSSGCTDYNAKNYDPTAENDDNSCEYVVTGCMDKDACNYNQDAEEEGYGDGEACLFASVEYSIDHGSETGGAGNGQMLAEQPPLPQTEGTEATSDIGISDLSTDNPPANPFAVQPVDNSFLGNQIPVQATNDQSLSITNPPSGSRGSGPVNPSSNQTPNPINPTNLNQVSGPANLNSVLGKSNVSNVGSTISSGSIAINYEATKKEVSSNLVAIQTEFKEKKEEQKNKVYVADNIAEAFFRKTTNSIAGSFKNIFSFGSCQPYFTKNYKFDDLDSEISDIKVFLDEFIPVEIGTYPYFDKNLVTFVSLFQEIFYDEILAPQGKSSPTGEWDDATKAFANAVLGCSQKVKIPGGGKYTPSIKTLGYVEKTRGLNQVAGPLGDLIDKLTAELGHKFNKFNEIINTPPPPTPRDEFGNPFVENPFKDGKDEKYLEELRSLSEKGMLLTFRISINLNKGENTVEGCKVPTENKLTQEIFLDDDIRAEVERLRKEEERLRKEEYEATAEGATQRAMEEFQRTLPQ